jgi:dihydrofolate reductase
VASRTLTEPLELNATLIKGDVANEVRKLRDDHNLMINGSGELVHALVQHGLIDDYRIWIHRSSSALGSGCSGTELGSAA